MMSVINGRQDRSRSRYGTLSAATFFFMTRTEQATWRATAMHLIRKGRVMMTSPDHLDRLAGESMVAMGRKSLADANRLQRHLLNCLAQTQR